MVTCVGVVQQSGRSFVLPAPAPIIGAYQQEHTGDAKNADDETADQAAEQIVDCRLAAA